MASRAVMVEAIEKKAEHHGRTGQDLDLAGAIFEVMEKHHTGGLDTRKLLDLLENRYLLFYAAGLKDPDEAADVTVRRWLDLDDAAWKRQTSGSAIRG